MLSRRLLYLFACICSIFAESPPTPVRIICIPSQIVPNDSFLITVQHRLPTNHSSAQLCVKGIHKNHTILAPQCKTVHRQNGCPQINFTLMNKTSVVSFQWIISYQLLPGLQKVYQYTDPKWVTKVGSYFLYDYPCQDCVFRNHEI